MFCLDLYIIVRLKNGAMEYDKNVMRQIQSPLTTYVIEMLHVCIREVTPFRMVVCSNSTVNLVVF